MSRFLPPLDWRTMSLLDMVEAICSDKAWKEGDEDDQSQLCSIARAVYWWTAGHSVDMDEVYEAHCKVGEHYHPGMVESGPSDEDESQEIYDALCEMSGNRCSCSADKTDNLKSDDPLEG